MFDISWSELLILAVVTLIFVGPKELPRFLSTVGRYTGVMRRHANEFRKVFDQAMREAELDQVKREMENVRNDVASTMRQAEQSATAPPRSPKPEARSDVPVAVAADEPGTVVQVPVPQVPVEHAAAPQPAKPEGAR